MEDTIRYHGFPSHLKPEQTVRVIAKEDYRRVHQQYPVHRHSFYELLFVWKGTGQQSIDFNKYAVHTGSAFFIQPNQIHQASQAQLDIFDIIIFNEEFYQSTHLLTTNLVFPSSNLYVHLSDAETIQFQKYLTLFKEEYFALADSLVLRNLLEVIIRLLGRTYSHQLLTIQADPRTRRFQELLERHFRREHLTSFYAHEVNLTVKHLNNVVKRDLGKSASTLIRERILLEIKRLLSYSLLSHKEIAYTLGFRDPAYMSYFFEKHVGVRPSRFGA